MVHLIEVCQVHKKKTRSNLTVHQVSPSSSQYVVCLIWCYSFFLVQHVFLSPGGMHAGGAGLVNVPDIEEAEAVD
jgi:hypothetical protein